jgi:acyl-CoA synthetase (AMP-forming)/AMP-acid ligase II
MALASAGVTETRADLRFRSVPGMVAQQAQALGGAPAIADGPEEVSYTQLAAGMEAAARALISLGVQPGDRVAVWGPNSAAWIVAALGTHACGAVLVPVNTRFKGGEAAYVLRRTEAKVLFVRAEFLGVDYISALREAAPDLGPGLQMVLLPGTDGPAAGQPWEAFLAAGAAVADASYRDRLAHVGPDSPADIIFTSGTTGRPKGVTLGHGQSLRAYEAFNAGFGLRRGDRYLVTNPFFHCFGYKAGWMLSLMVGATVLPHAVFDAGAVLDRVLHDQVTTLAGPPTVFVSLLEEQARSRRDLSSLKFAFTAASTVPVAVLERMRAELAVEVGTGYGLTESTAIATVTRRGDDAGTVSSTVGAAVEGVELAVVDGDGRRAAAGQTGEIVIRGFVVMHGYWDDPEATAAVVDQDGWLHTGDVGRLDDRGYLTITGRSKDIFIVGGFNVSPVEVENLLLADDRLAEVAVVGVPDDRLGEVAAAFVVPRRGVPLTADDVVSRARAAMANYKVPRYVVIVDSLPVNASGKVLKGELRARAAARAAL